MANNKNLEKGAPYRFVAGEEQVEIARKGAYAAAEAKRRKRSLREAAKVLLDMPVAPKQGKMRSMLEALDISADDMDYSMSIMAAMLIKATNGNVSAAQFIRDTAGENPYQDLEERKFEFEVREKTGQINDGNLADEIVSAYRARQRREQREAEEAAAAKEKAKEERAAARKKSGAKPPAKKPARKTAPKKPTSKKGGTGA